MSTRPRDPVTGQFLPEGATEQFDDVEVVTFQGNVGVEASNLAGNVGFNGELAQFEGEELVDYDDIVDRNEAVMLLMAHHALYVFQNSTATEDGVVEAIVGVSAAPSRTDVELLNHDTSAIAGATGGAVGGARVEDTIDLVGRPLSAAGHSPFSDNTNQKGGGGSEGRDRVVIRGPLPEVVGRFHPRDELFMNGQIRTWNIADAGVHVQLEGQHIYGVLED